MRLKEETGEVMLESGARIRMKTPTEARVLNGRKAMVWLAGVRNSFDLSMIMPLKRRWAMVGSDGAKSHLDRGI
ncbi:MAG: hypothetical protein HQ553_18635 [Chloroflexi bacterium]|nr:hypothetical protein [Chloroflexota bacterium]